MNHNNFWATLDELVAGSRIVIDRPAGSAHPRYPELIYPHNYGYLEGTQSADGGGIDVWVGSLPEQTITAVICTVDTVKRDSEIKILLDCTAQEAETIFGVHNSGPQSALLMERPQ